jgi:uncharacterized membrane protein YdbT with pleckstrin-like domain
MSDNNDYIKEAYIAEYNSLRNEALQRVGQQGTVLAWLLGLTGGFLGVALTLEVPDVGKSILIAAWFYPTISSLFAASILCLSYVITVELLIAFWIYQLFHMFRVSRYINRLSERYKSILDIESNIRIFGWDSEETRGFADANISNSDRFNKLIKFFYVLLL